MNRNTGFTLVELLVVISVISLLSSVVLANLQDVREKARYARAEEEVNLLVEAIHIVSEQEGVYLYHR